MATIGNASKEGLASASSKDASSTGRRKEVTPSKSVRSTVQFILDLASHAFVFLFLYNTTADEEDFSLFKQHRFRCVAQT